MSWVCKDKDESRFYDELMLNQLPDRNVGLLCATIIEDRLTDAIKVQWIHVKADLSDRLFSYQGPVGNFGSKIDIGFAIGIYDEDTFKDLHTIRKIRNAFAHKIAPGDFGAQQIKDLAANIKLPNIWVIEGKADGPAVVVSASNYNPSQDPSPQLMQAWLGASVVDDILSARNRFIRATELLNGLLFLAQLNRHGIPKPRYPISAPRLW
jgi:hypothetical protein